MGLFEEIKEILADQLFTMQEKTVIELIINFFQGIKQLLDVKRGNIL